MPQDCETGFHYCGRRHPDSGPATCRCCDEPICDDCAHDGGSFCGACHAEGARYCVDGCLRVADPLNGAEDGRCATCAQATAGARA